MCAWDAKAYRLKNRVMLRRKAKAYAIANKDSIAAYQKSYKQRPLSKQKRSAWMQAQRNAVTPFYLSHSFRCRVTKILKYRSSRDIGLSRTKALAFIDFEALKLKLEGQWLSGWTWRNWGVEWHIDHIWPCRIFDLTNPVHIQACFGIDNMRAISAKDNLAKCGYIPNDVVFPYMITPILKRGERLSFGSTYYINKAINE